MTLRNESANLVMAALMERNGRDTDEMVAVLGAAGISGRWLRGAVRYIRDTFGDDWITVEHRGPSPALYTLHPDREQLRAELHHWSRDALTRARHLRAGLDYASREHGDVGYVRRGGRYARNLVEELEDLVGVTGDGA